MSLKLPLWSLSPALLLLTLLFFIPSYMNYSFYEWFIGNLVVSSLIFVIYLIDHVKYIFINKKN